MDFPSRKGSNEMPHAHWLVVTWGLVLAAAATSAGGCHHDALDCNLTHTCAGSGGGGGMGDGGTGGEDAGASASVNCDPAKTMGGISTVDRQKCGFWVRNSGNDANDGTPDAPFQSIKAAVDAVLNDGGTKTNIYVCDESFTETVVLSGEITLHGGLDCANEWFFPAPNKTTLLGFADEIPLTVADASTVQVSDFAIAAADSVKPGGSSIAALVDGATATATFTSCSFLAGKASDGNAGTSGGAQAAPASPGLPGDDAGTSGSLNGGLGGTNTTCTRIGGDGGSGGAIVNGPGESGQKGDGGKGGTAGRGDSGLGCNLQLNPNGAKGMAGADGPVTPGIGTIDQTGYHGIDGQDGMSGKDGASGGGGGGSMATTSAHGAGGGGGGAGGCGGVLGTGGQAAGSSIALVSLSATVTLESCTLTSGNGGQGGAGGDGQFGQGGGDAGQGGKLGGGAASGCDGGSGGDGGNGGNGSGGLGGHSLGIAVVGIAPVLDNTIITCDMTPSSGGAGGNSDAGMNHGASGLSALCWDFSTPNGAACAL
jgi:hypothetical protein